MRVQPLRHPSPNPISFGIYKGHRITPYGKCTYGEYKKYNIQVYDDYTDDGFSGATFDRPDFNRMIQDIEKNKINLVIVKDLSRFGRVSNQISYYLEEYFIEKGVRFIAVTDDIDTGSIETSEDMVQFKAFFNEWFLRDTSRKVRNGKKTRAKEGKVMVTYPTYRL